jgi:hypothetical protein
MNEINGLADHAKKFSQFDRELHIKDNFKDQGIWQYLNRSNAQRMRELSEQNDLVDLSLKLGCQKL